MCGDAIIRDLGFKTGNCTLDVNLLLLQSIFMIDMTARKDVVEGRGEHEGERKRGRVFPPAAVSGGSSGYTDITGTRFQWEFKREILWDYVSDVAESKSISINSECSGMTMVQVDHSPLTFIL
ncbi:hypothetical protein VNO78_21743 [Psophocarpus tetragonolobus]|uniref:Uncharacterized protein n=1 Tax=Psophocarpus tetragonolobus TaxID=3891 RepID=A0AAN9SCQ5_PSOTE